MKYYAMIGGERRGPYELERLAEAGVRPDTYVWCKGMPDWEKAEDVADICRMFRIRIHDLMHPGSVDALRSVDNVPQSDIQSPPEGQNYSPSRFGRYLQETDQPDLPTVDEIEERRDTHARPSNMLPWAILSILFFPITGIIAVMMALKCRRAWEEAKSHDVGNDGESVGRQPENDNARDMRRLAHDFCQAAKLWTGVSFFLGLVLYAFLIRMAL